MRYISWYIKRQMAEETEKSPLITGHWRLFVVLQTITLGISIWLIWVIALIRYYSSPTDKQRICTGPSITNNTYKALDTDL